MSVLIKGMKMPKNGLYQIQDGKIHAYRGKGGKTEGYDLIEVPTPHGRLIDADEIIEVQMFDEMYETWTLKTMSVAEYLAFAADTPPTIIEAEEGAEDVSID